MEGTEAQIKYAEDLLKDANIQVKYAKIIIETYQDAILLNDKENYKDAVDLFNEIFDKMIRKKKSASYYCNIAIKTIELLKMATHNKSYNEEDLIVFLSTLKKYVSTIKTIEMSKVYYDLNTIVLYHFLERESKKNVKQIRKAI